MNKALLITHILQHLEQELANCKLAANNAHLAAIDDQSVAETRYDTLAIESAYLAEGQSRRIAEFESAIDDFQELAAQLVITQKTPLKTVVLGSAVQLAEDYARNNWFFIAPAAAGYRLSIDEKNFTVITPKSPMGHALLNKEVDNEIAVFLGNNKHVDDIIAIF